MRYLALGVLACLCIGRAAQAQTTDPQLMAPIQKFMDTFNKGDMAGAAATHAAGADLVIVDEVAPFLWRGPEAFQTWAADLDRDAKKQGITDQHVSIGPATRSEVDGDSAYVIVPVGLQLHAGRRGDACNGAHDVRVEEGRDGLADPRVDVDGSQTEEGAAASKP